MAECATAGCRIRQNKMRYDIKLDNPVWHSLSETHKNFAIECQDMKFYHPDYCPFGGFVNFDSTASCIDDYSKLVNEFYVIGDKPNFQTAFKLKKELVCHQMLLENRPDILLSEDIQELEEANTDDLFNLVNFVQPGYFRSKTSKLGSYYGIYKNHRLIAVTGERMKMNGYTEVSAVVTHPGHTGKGYAKQLVSYAANRIFGENKTPYLHVAETNIAAIKLYEKLGFKSRRRIRFWNLARGES
jgi:ribosomal protein S18 acetylase RimI-like enzyme